MERVCPADGRSDAELDAELTWLGALARDTDLTVPVARFSTHVATSDLPAGGRCTPSAGSRATAANAAPPDG